MSKANKQQHRQAAAKTQIPTPFTKAAVSINPFLERLDPAKVHITHIDHLSPDYKRKIFAIPVVLNAVIAALLLWRLYVAVPTYWLLAGTLLGYVTSATVDPEKTTLRQQVGVVFRRTLMFAFDFLLFRFITSWPITFFAERPASPVSWRWTLGFQKEEVIVRVSRHWGTEELMKGVKQGGENPFFKTRILPAIEPEIMRKTGYLTMGPNWDLEFELMLDAHTLAKQGNLNIADLDKLVLAYQDGIGWLVWKWEGEDGVMEERRKKVVAFKEKLTAMGKESLFWRWTEIVEEERDADGGFTAGKQQKVARRVQAEFEKNGVDFEEAMGTVGGLDEMHAPVK